MGSEVSASHRLMEAVGQQAQVSAKGEDGTGVYSPVILASPERRTLIPKL